MGPGGILIWEGGAAVKLLPRRILGVPPSDLNPRGGFGGSCCQRVAAAASAGSEVDDGAGAGKHHNLQGAGPGGRSGRGGKVAPAPLFFVFILGFFFGL